MISADEFATRRQRFLEHLPDGCVAIFSAAPEYIRNGDAHFRYRQDSDFFYLTGFPEAQAVAVFIPGRAEGDYILFNQECDEKQTLWHGTCVGQRGACEQYGAAQAFPIQRLQKMLPQLLQDCSRIYYPIGRYATFDREMAAYVQKLHGENSRKNKVLDMLVDSGTLLHDMRLFKSDAEIKLIKQAVQSSVRAHKCVMRACKTFDYEYQAEALLRYEFCHAGCEAPAYEPIVAAGNNACTLHYTANRAALNKKDLLLVDAGGEYHYYAADITRTFPLSGRFSTEQRALYEIVLQAQLAGIEKAQVGNTWTDIQTTIAKIITTGLCDLGILQGLEEQLLEQKTYQEFYMHQAGHWLGMDVHDVGSYQINGQERHFEPDMVLTVEPGIYISNDHANIADKWRGIGIRIEDDVLISQKGPQVLSEGAPKEITAIEEWMSG